MQAEFPKKKNSAARWMIFALTLLVIFLATMKYMQSDAGLRILGAGTVRGLAVTINDQPVQAEVFIPGTEHAVSAGKDGIFELGNVPAGEQSIVIAYDGIGQEIPVQIKAGQTTNIGKIQLAVTQTAP